MLRSNLLPTTLAAALGGWLLLLSPLVGVVVSFHHPHAAMIARGTRQAKLGSCGRGSSGIQTRQLAVPGHVGDGGCAGGGGGGGGRRRRDRDNSEDEDGDGSPRRSWQLASFGLVPHHVANSTEMAAVSRPESDFAARSPLLSVLAKLYRGIVQRSGMYGMMFAYVVQVARQHVLPIYILTSALQVMGPRASYVALGAFARTFSVLAILSFTLTTLRSRVSPSRPAPHNSGVADASTPQQADEEEDVPSPMTIPAMLSVLGAASQHAVSDTPASRPYNESASLQGVPVAQVDPSERPYALVTGASSGIGREVALSLADKGFCLILVGRKSDTLRETQKLLRRRSKESGRKGDRFLTVLGDLSMPGGAEAIWDDVSRLGCTIEAAVQCAGCCWRDQFVESPCSKIEEQLMTNVVGTTMLSRLAAEDMAKRGRGRILIISSMTALTPNPSVAAYAASKAYLRSFALALGSELEPRGVAVTCSLPGATTGTGFQERSNLDNALCFRIPGSACSVSTVASKSVDAMMQGDPEVIIGWSNRIWAHVLRPIMPPKVAMLVVQRTFR